MPPGLNVFGLSFLSRGRFSKWLLTANHTDTWWHVMGPLKTYFKKFIVKKTYLQLYHVLPSITARYKLWGLPELMVK